MLFQTWKYLFQPVEEVAISITTISELSHSRLYSTFSEEFISFVEDNRRNMFEYPKHSTKTRFSYELPQ